MDSIVAIGVGLILRIVVDVATENDDRVGGVLVGLWEGVVLNHFVRRMPRSFDPYLGFAFRIFVDFLFTQSLSRLALVALWALVGMLLADIAPNVWRESGLRHVYRQVRKDVRHVQRSVPHIRIKNDLPSVRLFPKSRPTSSEVSGSVRSDRAAPSRSPAPSPAPTPGPSRRQGRSPPGTFPDVSGWSETSTDVSNLRMRVVTSPGPSPALIPSREHTSHERIDTTHQVVTTQTQATSARDTTITITQTQNESVLLETVVGATAVGATAASSLGPIDDPPRHTLPAIADDWVDIDHPTPAKPNVPVAPFKPDPESTPEAQPEPPVSSQSPPVSILDPPPAIDVLSDIPHADYANRASQPPDQIPLPSSRAVSEIGGTFDQPQPRSLLRDNLRSRVDKAATEIGADSARPLATVGETHSIKPKRSWTSWARSKFASSVDVDALDPSNDTPSEPVDAPHRPDYGPSRSVNQGQLGVSSAAQDSEPPATTPAQVDPPQSILTQPRDATPLLLTSEPELPPPPQDQSQPSQPEQAPVFAGVDTQDVRDTASTRKDSLLDMPIPSCTPPPPFSEIAGVPEGPATGEAPAQEDPLTQDEPPTELTPEQAAAEEKRIAFLSTQAQELEASRASLQKKLDREDDPAGSPAHALESDLEDGDKTLASVEARIARKRFSEPPLNPPVKEVSVQGKTAMEAQSMITSAILEVLFEREDAGLMTIQVMINKQKLLKGKAKEVKDAVMVFAKRHRFTARSESAAPGIVNITF